MTMNFYVLDAIAIATFEVDADTEADARELVHELQGGDFGETAPRDTDTGIDADRICLRSLSTRLKPFLVEAYDDEGNDIAEAIECYLDPERTSIITDDAAAELAGLVDAIRAAAEGDSNDAEIDAGHALASAVESLIKNTRE